MNKYHFIVDASAFDKGLGNIKRWNQWLKEPKNRGKVQLVFYIPSFTLKELDFLQFRRRSFNAKESLKFIDSLVSSTSRNAKHDDPIEVILEYEDILDTIPWDHVNINHIDSLNRIPKRFKSLLKSCAYKCRIEQEDKDEGTNETVGHHWLLLTEDAEVKQLADQCGILHCSIVHIDSILAKEINDRTFQASEKFNDLVLKNGIKETSDEGEDVVKTKFKKTIYASRGSGNLWKP